MRFVRSLFAILAAAFVTAAAWEAQAQQMDPYVSCVRCHALPMQQARADMMGHGYGSPPEPELVCAGCHDTWWHQQDPDAPPPAPYFLFPAGGPWSFMKNACTRCHADHSAGTFIHADDVFPFYNGTPPSDPPLLAVPPTSVLPLFEFGGAPNQSPYAGGLVCSTCHDSHEPSYSVNGIPKFLRIGSWVAPDPTAPLCRYCHDMGTPPTTGDDRFIPSDSGSVRFELMPAGDLRIDVTVRNRGNAYPYSTYADVFWEDETGYRWYVGWLPLFSISPEGETVVSISWMPPPQWVAGEGFFVFVFPPRLLAEGSYGVEFVRSMNILPPPANVRVTNATSGEITLAWDQPLSPPADLGWDVYRDGVRITPTPILPYFPPSFVDGGLAPGTPHVYQVVAVSLGGGLPSQPSDPVGGTTDAAAAIIRVPQDFPTIQQAIDGAAYGTVIQVAPGTYSEQLNLSGKYGITVKGQDANGCVLDYSWPGVSGPAVDLGFAAGQPGNTLAGFTVRNGWIHMDVGDVLSECVIVADTQVPPLVSGGGLVAQCVFETTTPYAFHIEPGQFLTSVNSVYLVWEPFAGYLPPAESTLLLNNNFPYWPGWIDFDGSGNFGEYPSFVWPGPPQEYLPDPGSPTVGRGLPLDIYDPTPPNVGAFQPWRLYTPQPPSGLAATTVPETPARVRLTWTASIDDPARMFEYFIYRSESPIFPPSTPSNAYGMVPAGIFAFEDQNIVPGTTYYYQVRGYDGPAPEGTELLSAPTNTASAALLNSPPIAVDDAATTRQNQPVTIAVLANDSDPEGDAFHVFDIGYPQYPQHGSAHMNADETIEYTPYPGFAGTDSFSYTVMDAWGGIATAVVTVTITPNSPPVAMDDAYITNEDTPLVVPPPGVLGNDTDPDGDALEALVVSAPAHGTLASYLDGSFVYTPPANFSGADSFTYFAGDGQLASALATVTITVLPTNIPPVANGKAVIVAEDGGVAVTLTATDADGDPLTYAVVSGPAHGTLSGAAPNLAYAPALNYFGPDSFTFTANDGQATSAPATVSVTVTPVNDPPVFVKGPDQTVNEDAGPQTSAGWATGIADADPETVQTLTFSATNDNNALFTAQPAIAGDGTLSYTAAANANGVATVIVTLTDDATAGGPAITTAAQSFTITVTPVNDPPQANDDSAATAAHVPVLIAVLGNDTDGDGDTPTVSSATPGANGSTAVQAGGSILYTPNPGFTGTDSFSYAIDDGNGGSDTAAVTVSVRPQRLRITAVTMATVTSGRYTSATATPLAVDEAGAPLAGVSVDGRWSGLTSDVDTGLTGTDGKVTVSSNQVRNANGIFTFTIDAAVKAGYEMDGLASVLTNSIQYPAPPPPGGEMHVASIVMGLKTGKNTSATAEVTVVDANGVPVASAAVSGSWSDAVSGTSTGTTGADGKVTLSSAGIKSAAGKTFTFTFTGISRSGWTYDSAADVETVDSITAP